MYHYLIINALSSTKKPIQFKFGDLQATAFKPNESADTQTETHKENELHNQIKFHSFV